MTPRAAGLRLIMLSLPFLAFGLLWALRPPMADALGGEITAIMRVLGVALALFGVTAISFGVWLALRREKKVL